MLNFSRIIIFNQVFNFLLFCPSLPPLNINLAYFGESAKFLILETVDTQDPTIELKKLSPKTTQNNFEVSGSCIIQYTVHSSEMCPMPVICVLLIYRQFYGYSWRETDGVRRGNLFRRVVI